MSDAQPESGLDRIREAYRIVRGEMTGTEVVEAIQRTWSPEMREHHRMRIAGKGHMPVPMGWMWGQHVVQCDWPIAKGRRCRRFFWGRKRYERHWIAKHSGKSYD